jgi:ATP-binding cassette, subfamily B, bacterial MsbA
MNDFQRLFRFVRPYLSLLGFSLLLLLFAGLFEVLTTALPIFLFDQVLVAPQSAPVPVIDKTAFLQSCLNLIPGSIVTQLSVALLLLTLLKGISLYYSNYSMSHVGQGVVRDLRNNLFHHVLDQSMAFFSLNSTGRLMSRMSSDVDQVQEAVSTLLADLFREVVLLLALMAWVLYLDWKLAALSLLIAPAAAILTLTMGKRIRLVTVKSREDVANLSDQLQQSITGMRILKAFGMEKYEEAHFAKGASRLFSSNMKAARILFLNSPVMEFLAVLAFIPVLFYAQARILEGTLTLGYFGGSLFSLFRMYDPIRKLSRMHVQFERAFASAGRIAELFDTHIEIKDHPDARKLEGISERIEFRDVCFDYCDSASPDPVLHHISLRVNRKQVIALVGSSGSGKSTLVGLIPRFYDPTSGCIQIDSTDIRQFTQASLRSQIAVVTQETFLFNDTIRNNIAYGDVGSSEDRVIEAAKAALAHEFILRFPKQYDTIIGERGQRLSGGERQRISIARAILKDAPILILDEATSALDSESEKLVQQALINLMQDRTTFVIAHRLSTIRNADLIVVLEHGRIVESGTHDSLIERDGPYRRFFRLQTEEAFLPAENCQ